MFHCKVGVQVLLNSPTIAAIHPTFHFLRFDSLALVLNRFEALFHGPNVVDIHVYHRHAVAPKSNAMKDEKKIH